ncbi:MAG TPA: hypothetical protein VFC51_08465 [Chloroflexota bacterium]|nr:hypothetical protein [Chloroflexota bacterium]
MASPPKYLELRIDVFAKSGQRAQVLPEIRPPDLVAAILEEFGDELDILGAAPEAYWLRKAEGNERLDDLLPLEGQVHDGEHLVLEETDPDLPAHTRRPARSVYLQESTTQRAFKIPWVPAIVGRSDPDLPENDLVAVDLSAHPGGGRVSRRHLRLWEENGEYYIQTASANPASIVRDRDVEIPVPAASAKERLLPQDIIRLDRSQITLKFIVREG